MASKRKNVRFSIRTKLLLLSVTFLAVPYTAYQSLLELENSLRKGLESSLLDVGQSLSALLAREKSLLRTNTDSDGGQLFIHALKQPINLDGYKGEWQELLEWSNHYQTDKKQRFSFRLVLAKQGNHLYVLVDVEDASIVYYQPSDSQDLNADHISMIFENNQGEIQRYEFAPEALGQLIPFKLEQYWLHEEDKQFVPPELRKVFITNIQGHWQPTETGYTLELAIPWYLLKGNLGFVVHDYDDVPLTETPEFISTFSQDELSKPNTLIRQSEELNQIINSLGITESRRIWVLDTLGQVIAVDGSLKSPLKKTPVNIFYEIILPKTYEIFQDELTEASSLEGSEIQTALKGETSTRWRSSIDDKAVILSAAVPIKKDDQLLGLVVVEETTNSIQILKRNALAKLFNRTLLVFIGITLLLLLFATQLSFRLRRLSRQSNEAIDEHGRVVATLKASQANDELGELSRNYANMLDRLQQYHSYLEGMAGKLSHELRTPMTVVQSSLENLEQESDAKKAQEYLLRAKQGIVQLNHLVSRLSEATRLEQALQQSELEMIDLYQLLEICISGYQNAFNKINFQLTSNIKKQTIRLAPELIVQMLDKLISNAVDFHTPGTAICIHLERFKRHVELSVSNQGSLIAEEMRSQLFQSMVSKREQTSTLQTHLGLGLYIVRLIAEFHGGKVNARNMKDKSGVIFIITLPVS